MKNLQSFGVQELNPKEIKQLMEGIGSCRQWQEVFFMV